MENKLPHVVFQVINFTQSESSKLYNLLLIDRLILINLASHQGPKGIFPSQQTIARELNITTRHLINRTEILKKNGLINVKKLGIKNYYYLTDLCKLISNKLSTGEPQFTDQKIIGEPQFTYEDSIGEPQFTKQVNPSSPNTCTPVHLINSINNSINNRERERPKPAAKPPTLSLSNFNSNEENRILAMELRLNLQDEIASFKSRHNGNGDLQYEFSRWLKNSRQYQNKKNANNSNSSYGQNSSSVDPYAHLENYTEKRLAREAEERRKNPPKPEPLPIVKTPDMEMQEARERRVIVDQVVALRAQELENHRQRMSNAQVNSVTATQAWR